MKITISAIGKGQKPSPTFILFEEYRRRTPWKIELKEMEEKKNLNSFQLKESEAKMLLDSASSASVIVALDENGKNITSKSFASMICNWQNEGHNHISFLIGGALGHGKEVLERANSIISFGNMTWPHMLVRSMLSEQIYRAYTIIHKHPYHKD
jgi:23S rRNA (pseudouridine1915-N3)-methyltransferase